MADLSFYDVSVPAFQQVLRALSGVLDKAAAHCEAKRIDPAFLINDRLYPDMFPLNVQVGQSISHSAGATARLVGVEPMKPAPGANFEEMKRDVTAALTFLDGVQPAQLASASETEISFDLPRGALKFDGKGYLLSFALPNFYFHTTAAYAILRHNGVELGKRDYLGAFQLKA